MAKAAMPPAFTPPGNNICFPFFFKAGVQQIVSATEVFFIVFPCTSARDQASPFV